MLCLELMSFAIVPSGRGRRRRSLLLTTRPLRCMNSWKIAALLCISQIQMSTSFMPGTSGATITHPDRHVPLVDAAAARAAAAAGTPAASAESSVTVKVKRSARNPVDTSQVQRQRQTKEKCTTAALAERFNYGCVEAECFNWNLPHARTGGELMYILRGSRTAVV